MARIRTIKPEFFRDEVLSELEAEYPEARPMLVFSGLWGHCDKQGVFPWNPRQLALDILPFVWGETSGKQLGFTLELLCEAGRVWYFEAGGKTYGFIPTFQNHQRVTGKEHTEPPRYPKPPERNTGETPGKQPGCLEGKGREGGREVGKGITDLCVSEKKSPTNSAPVQRKPKRYPDDFELFWKAYPKRTNSGSKAKALKAWKKACDEVDPQELVEHANRFCGWCDKTGNTGSQFVPMVTTWLNGKEWEAELSDNGGDPNRRDNGPPMPSLRGFDPYYGEKPPEDAGDKP